MIVDMHPVLTKLHESDFRLYLTGSRYYRTEIRNWRSDKTPSDYDFYLIVDAWKEEREAEKFLKETGFERVLIGGYNEDRYFKSHYRFSQAEKDDGNMWPSVDVVLISSDEFEIRKPVMDFLRKRCPTHSGSRDLVSALKKNWPEFWALLHSFKLEIDKIHARERVKEKNKQIT